MSIGDVFDGMGRRPKSSGRLEKKMTTIQIRNAQVGIKQDLQDIGRELNDVKNRFDKRDELVLKLLAEMEQDRERIEELERAYDSLVDLLGEMQLNAQVSLETEKKAASDDAQKLYDREYTAGRVIGTREVMEGLDPIPSLADEKNVSPRAIGYRSGVKRVKSIARQGRRRR